MHTAAKRKIQVKKDLNSDTPMCVPEVPVSSSALSSRLLLVCNNDVH